MEALKTGSDVLFVLLGGIMVLAMHAGFAFLELGTVRKKNQVNALVKILADFSVSTIAYFFVGYSVAYGISFFVGAEQLAVAQRLRAGQVLLPADLRGGDPGDRLRRHRRARPLLPAADRHRRRSSAWSTRSSRASRGTRHFGIQDWLNASLRRASSTTSPARWWCTRWAAGSRCRGAAAGRAQRALHARTARSRRTRRRTFPFLALGAWILTVGWFGFNVMTRAD